MNLVLNIIRILTAVLAPLSAVILGILTILHTNPDQGESPQEGQHCLRCGLSRQGAEGQFQFTESAGNARERAANKQLTPSEMPILGSESHFICDHCAHRYIRNEIFQVVLMVLPYPIYLYFIIPIFVENGVFANFMIETLLLVLSLAGLTSVFNLYRGARSGKASLTEARDRVAISQRKNTLGKKFNYYTRMGMRNLKD